MTTEPSEAAKAKARELLIGGAATFDRVFARFIQEVSDAAKEAVMMIRNGYGDVVAEDLDCLKPFILPESVDSLLIEARKLACGCSHSWPHEEIMAGAKDETPALRDLLRALQRGIELGKGQS